MIITKLKDAAIEEKQINPKWRNLYFGKDGKRHNGSGVFESIEQADKIADGVVQTIRECNKNKKIVQFIKCEPPLYSDNYSWHMQIPIL